MKVANIFLRVGEWAIGYNYFGVKFDSIKDMRFY